MMRFFKEFYFTNTFFYVGIALICFCVVAIFFPILLNGFWGLLGIVGIIILLETYQLFKLKNPIKLHRKLPNRLSMGAENEVQIVVTNLGQNMNAIIIEDLPEQLQIRDFEITFKLVALQNTILNYSINPKTRGLLTWQTSHLKIKKSPFSLVSRVISFNNAQTAPSYPSFEQFKKLPIKALVTKYFDTSSQNNVKKIGQSLEFEQIKEYNVQDDFRHINWKASAKANKLMLNQYRDERSQDIYAVIDCGRTMYMPFKEQTLLDYAINSALALSKAAVALEDKAGVIALKHPKIQWLPARKDGRAFGRINDFLYQIDTNFKETDFEILYKFSRVNIKQRSLFVIFTNFDTIQAMYRQLPYLKALSRHHLLLLVMYENTELLADVQVAGKDLREVYTKTIEKQMLDQSRLISKELTMNGINSLFISPNNLNIKVINKVIELKRRQMI